MTKTTQMTTTPEPHTILIVDDDEPLRRRVARALQERGWTTHTAASVDDALAHLDQGPLPERAIIDLRMPDKLGLELVAALHERSPLTKILMLTGYGSIASTVDALRLGAIQVLPKPADADDILLAFARAEAPVPLPAEEPAYETPSLARAEWEHIHRVLADCDGNISEAARRLGLHRRSLQRKLQKYSPP
jgi:two-component system response regulator RegA